MQVNSLRVSRDIIWPENLFDRPSIHEIAAIVGKKGRLEAPNVALISAKQSLISMRGGPTLQKLLDTYDMLAEAVNELNTINPAPEGQLGELSLLGKTKSLPGIPRYIGFMLAGNLADQMIADDHYLREAVCLKLIPRNPHATIFQAKDSPTADYIMGKLTDEFDPAQNIILTRAYIEPAFHPGYPTLS